MAHETARQTILANVEGTSLDPMPLPPEQVTKGEPEASWTILWVSDDGKLANGIWECTPGEFDYIHADETATVVKGRATVTPEGGEPIVLESGSVVFFPAGTKTKWRVEQTIRKAFHLHASEGLGI